MIIKFFSWAKNRIISNKSVTGWGRKRSGLRATKNAVKFNVRVKLKEDGFIRSIGLGDSMSFSEVEDDLGIYYDATVISRLEKLIIKNAKDNPIVLETARKAIHLIKHHEVSKYNAALEVTEELKEKLQKNPNNILIIAQTKADMSLEYGLANTFAPNDIITAAVEENPNTNIYLKVHTDVLNGRKESDIDLSSVPKSIKIISEDVNPISLLKQFTKVYTKTSQMGFEALMVGCECVCFGMPFYAGWGLTDDRVQCKRRTKKRSLEEVFAAAYILYPRYYNPYTKKSSDVIDTIKTIVKYRDIERKANEKLYLFGFSRWKHNFTIPFLTEYKKENIHFINPIFSAHLDLALKNGLSPQDKIYVWGKKGFSDLETWTKENGTNITRVEDGFIRSVGLGSDLTRPYSLVVDDLGIYFDPQQESRLENILSSHDFATIDTNNLAHTLISKIQKSKISKYNTTPTNSSTNFPKNKTIKLVIGQVEDDASIIYGGNGMTNQELLTQVRNSAGKEAYIIYKPHPDVLSGNRIGIIPDDIAQSLADSVSTGNIHDLLDISDEVHTITSLTGFEALMKQKTVFTYGMPFYAGWGLTTDKKDCLRRKRKLSLEELVVGTLILYPRYIDPETYMYCDPEQLIDELLKQKAEISNSSFVPSVTKAQSTIVRKFNQLKSFFR
jgi:capsular polysaccharide export protein